MDLVVNKAEVTLQNPSLYIVAGQWLVNNQQGNFINPTNIDLYITNSDYIGNVFVDLTPNAPKDLVVGRTDGLEVHHNNGTIGSYDQNFTNPEYGFARCIQTGSFDNGDNLKDVIVSRGTTQIEIYKNLKNSWPGHLSTPQLVSFQQNVFKFTLRQMDQKCDGYVQDDPTNRSDIVFVDNQTLGANANIYGYINNNVNGFNGSPFFEIQNVRDIKDLELADLDNDGFNDLIYCAYHSGAFIAAAYRNIQGSMMYTGTPMWTVSSLDAKFGTNARFIVKDVNKDGYPDIVFVSEQNSLSPGIKVNVFINQSNASIFTQIPQEQFTVPNTVAAHISDIAVEDIYGGAFHDGGGFAILIGYAIGSPYEIGVKVVNAVHSSTAPQPPIVQSLLIYDQGSNLWRPHIHLNNKGERDFDYYQIYKWKEGMPVPLLYADQVRDTGWTDVNECIPTTGQDTPWWNCFYYAIAVDKFTRVSSPSLKAYFYVCLNGCVNNACNTQCLTCLDSKPKRNDHNALVPSKFEVSIYPNPFNPNTNIKISLPQKTYARLVVYNEQGQIVASVLDQELEAGYYTLLFQGELLASGVYFYKFNAGRYMSSGKLVLIK